MSTYTPNNEDLSEVGQPCDISDSKYKYDVFICKKSEDVALAEEILHYLEDNNYTCFLSERNLPDIGDSNYYGKIDEALDQSKNMIVVCSDANYLNTPWVRHEWQSFSNEKMSSSDRGNVVTIITSNVKREDVPFTLRNLELIQWDSYKRNLLSYIVATNNAKRLQYRQEVLNNMLNNLTEGNRGEALDKIKKQLKIVLQGYDIISNKDANRLPNVGFSQTEDRRRYDIMQNEQGEVLLVTDVESVVDVKSPLFIYDGTDDAILYRNSTSCLFFDDIAESAHKVLSSQKEIRILELQGDDVVNEYRCSVRMVPSVKDLLD